MAAGSGCCGPTPHAMPPSTAARTAAAVADPTEEPGPAHAAEAPTTTADAVRVRDRAVLPSAARVPVRLRGRGPAGAPARLAAPCRPQAVRAGVGGAGGHRGGTDRHRLPPGLAAVRAAGRHRAGRGGGTVVLRPPRAARPAGGACLRRRRRDRLRGVGGGRLLPRPAVPADAVGTADWHPGRGGAVVVASADPAPHLVGHP